ncbi:hypothetical protein [Bifidobacterium cebidarum]|uniref:PhnA protein n=1 Tax=Bifidobacterium cebidarum TaxID=2650773 RepID=A0A6I1GAY6_9BIFI|nr:hypothetical protein [Bifidobacterium cebidarum]KAB7787358.1 hypothetical protein F7D08_1533 [Bifidobacterium cebidarum]
MTSVNAKTGTYQLQKDLCSLVDNWSILDLIANRQATIGIQVSDRRSNLNTASMPIPLDIDAFQLLQDINRFARMGVRLLGLHPYRNLSTPTLLKSIIKNLPRLDTMSASIMEKLSGDARTLVERLARLLNPPESTRMVGWCPICNYELRADEEELAGGWLECPRCYSTHRIKDIHELDMLRLRLSGVKGTPTQLHRVLKPWGIDVKAATIRQWARRNIIQPVGQLGNASVFLVWDVWQAYTRFDKM